MNLLAAEAEMAVRNCRWGEGTDGTSSGGRGFFEITVGNFLDRLRDITVQQVQDRKRMVRRAKKKITIGECLTNAKPRGREGEMSEDKCFFCGEERCLVLQCQICHAFNVKKSVDIFTELTALRGLVKEMGVFIRELFALELFIPKSTTADKILNHPEVKKIMEEEKDERRN